MIHAQAEGDVLDALNLVRADAPGVVVPVVACVSLTMPGDEERLRAEGIAACLRRPVARQRLKQIVESMMMTNENTRE